MLCRSWMLMRNVWESLMISEASSLRKGTSTQMRSKTQLMDSTQSKYCKMHFFLWCVVRQHCQTGLSKVAFCWQKLLSTVWCELANSVRILFQFFRKHCKKRVTPKINYNLLLCSKLCNNTGCSAWDAKFGNWSFLVEIFPSGNH